LKFPRRFAFPDRGSREILPVGSALVLLAAAALQLVLPWAPALPADAGHAALRAPDPRDPVRQHYGSILHAPIFAPDRAPVADAEEVAGGLNGYVAMGIAAAGDTAAALVRGPDGQVMRVRRGDSLAGWQLTGVDRTELTFERGGDQRVLRLDGKAQRAQAPASGAGDDGASDNNDNNAVGDGSDDNGGSDQ
jgi:hypothetical protein